MPLPESADLPPPTIRDITPARATESPAATTHSTPSDITNTVPAEPAAQPAAATTAIPTPAVSDDKAKSSPPAEKSASTPVQEKVAINPVGERLRDLLASGKFDRILGGKKERGTIEAFYSSRDFAPLWVGDAALSERGKAAVAYLGGIEADALDPADYPIPEIKAAAGPDALAEAELKFTDSVLTFTRHASTGRVHYSRVSGDIIYTLTNPEPADVLAKLARASDVGAALDSYNPQQPGYKALKAKLAEFRHGADDINKPVIASGPTLKYGKDKKGNEVLMQDPRVPALREWFSLKATGGDTTYDKELSGAIAKFQKEHRISPTGQFNQATLDAMNGPKREKTLDIIMANMERWRWMPRDLGKTYVMVNIPDFTLRVVHDNKLVWKTKIVVGQPGKPTPLLSADMKFITVNPTWNVPPSIIQNEYLPALQQDPQALDRIGLKVEQNRDGTIRIYQPPGDRNALGRIRFNFPNKFLVYQHDTPDKHLFAHDKRAYSHGCMRVENPLKYGEVLLGLALPHEHYTAERLQKMFGGSEININFPTGIPDHLTYQTAFVDDDGKLQIRDDVYGRDAKLISIMKGSERKVADIAIERSHGSSSAPVRMPPGTFGSASNGWGSGPSFFDRLFGAPEPTPAPRSRSRLGRANDRGHNFR